MESAGAAAPGPGQGPTVTAAMTRLDNLFRRHGASDRHPGPAVTVTPGPLAADPGRAVREQPGQELTHNYVPCQ